MEKNFIKVIINSSFAVGLTPAHVSQFHGQDKIIIELKPGTTVKQMLLKLPFLGSPEKWDDIMLHVFVNHRIASFDQVLKDKDIVDLHIPVSGG